MVNNNQFKSQQLFEIILFGILFLFFFQLLVDFVEGIYAFGLMGSGIPNEIVAVLLLFSPLLMLLLPRGISNRTFVGLGFIILLSRSFEVLLDTRLRIIVSGVGVACFLVLFPSVLWYLGRKGRKTGAVMLGASLTLALSIEILSRVINSGLDSMTDGDFIWLGWVLALVSAILLPILFRAEDSGSKSEAQGSAGTGFGGVTALTLGLMAVLIMLYFAFTAPNVIARWTESSYILIVSVLTIALAVFALILVFRPAWLTSLSRSMVFLWNVLFVASLVLTIYLNQVDFATGESAYPIHQPTIAPWAYLPLLVMLVLFPVVLFDFILYCRELIVSKPSYRSLGGAFSVAAFFLLVMIFAHVFTTVYDYIPVVGPFFRDKFWLVYLVSGAALVLPLFAVQFTNSEGGFTARNKLPYKVVASLIGVFGLITITVVIYSAPRPGVPVGGDSTLEILTYNIQQGYSEDGQKNYYGQLDEIRNIEPDIIGLQESDTNRIANGNGDIVRLFADRLDMYSYYGPKTVNGTFGIALLSKYPIENAQTFYMYSEGEQTATIEAQIAVDGKTFNVYVTHLGNGGPIVQQQEILKTVDGKENVILMGDFNFRPYEEQYAITTAVLEDAWIVRWPGGNQNQGIDPMERIDHTFLSPGTTVIDSVYNPSAASDHPWMLTVISW